MIENLKDEKDGDKETASHYARMRVADIRLNDLIIYIILEF